METLFAQWRGSAKRCERVPATGIFFLRGVARFLATGIAHGRGDKAFDGQMSGARRQRRDDTRGICRTGKQVDREHDGRPRYQEKAQSRLTGKQG